MQPTRYGCSHSTLRHRFIADRQYTNKGLSVDYLPRTIEPDDLLS